MNVASVKTEQDYFVFDFVLQNIEILKNPISGETIAIALEQKDYSPYKVPKLDDIIKSIEKAAYSVDTRNLISDIFESCRRSRDRKAPKRLDPRALERMENAGLLVSVFTLLPLGNSIKDRR